MWGAGKGDEGHKSEWTRRHFQENVQSVQPLMPGKAPVYSGAHVLLPIRPFLPAGPSLVQDVPGTHTQPGAQKAVSQLHFSASPAVKDKEAVFTTQLQGQTEAAAKSPEPCDRPAEVQAGLQRPQITRFSPNARPKC